MKNKNAKNAFSYFKLINSSVNCKSHLPQTKNKKKNSHFDAIKK